MACVVGVVVLVVFASGGIAQPGGAPPQRVSFQISTGSTSGSDFSVGELLAGLLSHPPGISRCETANLCGPAGLIVSTRATEGSVANVLAVNAGATTSGLAQSDVVALAVGGRGPFAQSGPARQLRVIANLYGQTLHLLAATEAEIITVSDLRGKRVSLSTEGSGTIVTARAVLQAYQVAEWRVVPNYDSIDTAAELLREGELDAFFFVGGTPVNLIEQLIEEELAVLIPIDGDGRDRLLGSHPYLSETTIPQGTYSGTPPIETVRVGTLWITNVTQSNEMIYGMVKAVYNPRNRPMINARRTGSNFLELSMAADDPLAPLHQGAIRYYAEAGVFPSPANPAVPKPKP